MCYDIKSNKWTYIDSMIESSYHASCAIFNGKIVVTGGCLDEKAFALKSNSSESYCFHENKWTYFRDTLVKRSGHATLTISNKLFVIGGHYKNDCEVFESITNKFVFIENLPKFRRFDAVSFADKIFVFRKVYGNCEKEDRSEKMTFCYNEKQNVWIQENILQLKYKVNSCAKISIK